MNTAPAIARRAAPFHIVACAAYGLLGLPLAMSALPLYVQIPAYYASHLGLALASTGWILFLARLFDTLQDPLLGLLIDKLDKRLALWLLGAGVALALGFLGLWIPPKFMGAGTQNAYWESFSRKLINRSSLEPNFFRSPGGSPKRLWCAPWRQAWSGSGLIMWICIRSTGIV